MSMISATDACNKQKGDGSMQIAHMPICIMGGGHYATLLLNMHNPCLEKQNIHRAYSR